MCGWASPNFILLTSDETPLQSGPLTISEASFVVSLSYIGGFIGTIAASMFAERFGRKISLLILLIPQTVSKCGSQKLFLHYLVVLLLLVKLVFALYSKKCLLCVYFEIIEWVW